MRAARFAKRSPPPQGGLALTKYQERNRNRTNRGSSVGAERLVRKKAANEQRKERADDIDPAWVILSYAA
jgi:hypothetical protein